LATGLLIESPKNWKFGGVMGNLYYMQGSILGCGTAFAIL
jgi:hypothetical protein